MPYSVHVEYETLTTRCRHVLGPYWNKWDAVECLDRVQEELTNMWKSEMNIKMNWEVYIDEYPPPTITEDDLMTKLKDMRQRRRTGTDVRSSRET